MHRFIILTLLALILSGCLAHAQVFTPGLTEDDLFAPPDPHSRLFRSFR